MSILLFRYFTVLKVFLRKTGDVCFRRLQSNLFGIMNSSIIPSLFYSASNVLLNNLLINRDAFRDEILNVLMESRYDKTRK